MVAGMVVVVALALAILVVSAVSSAVSSADPSAVSSAISSAVSSATAAGLPRIVQYTLAKLDVACCGGGGKVAIMRGEQDGAIKASQCLKQISSCFEIQVVCRFVTDEHCGRREEHLCQAEARTLTAGKGVQRRVLHRPRQAKLLHHAIQALLEDGSAVSSAHRAVNVLSAGVTLHITHHAGTAARAQRLHSGPRAH